MDITKLEKILEILKRNDITKFEMTEEGTQLKLSRKGSGERVLVSAPAGGGQGHELAYNESPAAGGTASNGAASQAFERAPVAVVDSHLAKVESPIVGTFFRRPAPDAESFVEVGDSVKKGDTLCIIEAMKIMNEIEAPCGGKIEKILLTDGQVVEFGEILFLIDPKG